MHLYVAIWTSITSNQLLLYVVSFWCIYIYIYIYILYIWVSLSLSLYVYIYIYTHIYIYIYIFIDYVKVVPHKVLHDRGRDALRPECGQSGVNRGQRERKGSFRGYPNKGVCCGLLLTLVSCCPRSSRSKCLRRPLHYPT